MWFNIFILFFGAFMQSQTVLSVWTCTQDLDCADAEGAFCSAGNCACPVGQQFIFGNSLCANAAPYLTSSCLEDQQCSRLVTNFECRGSNNTQEGNCFCRDDFHYQDGRCWRSTDYGEACIRNADCFGVKKDPFSMSCLASTSTCGCADGYYRRQAGECRIIAPAVGHSCVLDEDCQFPNGRCNILTFSCYASVGGLQMTIPKEKAVETQKLINPMAQQDGGSVNIPSQHGALCSATNNCPAPYVCSVFGSCVCPVGYYWSGRGDFCYAELGSPSTPEQCVGFLAEVRNGICTCRANFFFEEDIRNCIKVARNLNDFCLNDVMCHTFGTAARCTPPISPWGLRHCECTPGISVWDEARSMCRRFVGIGDACETNSDCLAGTLEINCVSNAAGQGICTCPPNTVAENGLCLSSGLVLGASCQVTSECTGTANTECSEGVCSCGSGYLETGGICAPGIGGSCTADAQCVIANTVCATSGASQTCQCADNFIGVNNVCLPALSDLSSNCTVTEQCVALIGQNSECEANSCSCIAGHHFRDQNCWPHTGLFEDCSRTSQCFLQGMSERVVCRNSMCQCSFDYPYSEELHTCSSATSITMGSLFTFLLALTYLMSH
ncbi:unnamed protein product [Arctia plantaginis]|uniref:EB domain-containing protein n=1 Tax=Arctia plantaginis TaxID=874455 RepID=A0A8S1B0I0_ARCPL|nr:unnamed protein product [Arctia plantaginis]